MTATLVRHPAVAGRFYPHDPKVLREEVHTYLSQAPRRKPVCAIGCIAPHAGYMYSGHVAGAVFAGLEIPSLCLVLCPNHTGVGRALAIMSEGAWETPLGDVPIDNSFADALKQRCPLLQEDSAAHRSEHAAEVELPFLQVRQTPAQVRSHRAGHRSVRSSRATRRSHCGRDCGAERPSPDRRLQRHEPLRIRRHHPREGPQRDRANSRPRRPRPLRCGHPAAHQHVRLRPSGRDADGREEAGRHFGRIGEICNFRRYLWRPRYGRGLCGSSGSLRTSSQISDRQLVNQNRLSAMPTNPVN